MMNPIPGQANVRSAFLVDVDAAAITTGTVNFYLRATTGDNAGKWFRGSDSSWQAAEAIAGAMTHVARGLWDVTIAAAAWIADVEYQEYAKESGDSDVPMGWPVRCEYPGDVSHWKGATAPDAPPSNAQMEARTLAAADYATAAAVAAVDTVVDVIKARTDLLGSGIVGVVANVSLDGQILRLTRGDAYLIASGTAVEWTFPAGTARDLTNVVAVRFSARDKATDALLIDGALATVVEAGAGQQIVDLELTAAQTAGLPVGSKAYFDLKAYFGGDDNTSLVSEGLVVVKREATRV